MFSLLKKFSPLVILFVVVAAVSITAFSRNGQKAASEAPAPRTVAAQDPLKIVLTPMGGETKLDAQIGDLQRRIKDAPEKGALLERLGWAFVSKARVSSDPGYYTLAEQAAKAIIATTPDEPAATLLLGHTYHAMHRFADAEAAARTLTSRREFAFDFALLGDALMEQGKLDAAVEAYQKMVDLKPSLQTYSRVAHMRWLKGDLAGAIDASRLAVSSGSAREAEPMAWAYTRLALLELQAGDTEQARVAAERAVNLMPDYAPALLMRGRLLLSQLKYDEAIEPLRRAAELSPLPDYLWALADALRAASKTTEAEKVEGQLSSSGAVSDPRTLAIFLASRGQSAEKAVELATAELQSRKDIFSYDALAWAQLAAGRVNEAREHMRLALAEGTQDARLYYHAGAIAAAAGADAEALDFFGKARAIEQTLLPSERAALSVRSAALFEASSQFSVN